jgi:hypothetical protein
MPAFFFSSFFQQILVLTLGSPPEKGGKKIKNNPGINPGQPAGKGREKKTLVSTLGSPSEKGGNFFFSNPGINPGQPAERGGRKKKKPWY